MAENAGLLKLLTWLSPAFPTGGFAYSHGLEWSVEASDVTNEATLTNWCEDMLSHGALWQDAVLLRHTHRATLDDQLSIAELAVALTASSERLLETTAQGAAFALAAAAWAHPALAAWPVETPLPYPVSVGRVASAHGLHEDDTSLAYIHACIANFISAAIRLIPLGQTAGLRVQAALEPACLRTAHNSASATLADIGTASWAADIAAMNHETQYTRLFRS